MISVAARTAVVSSGNADPLAHAHGETGWAVRLIRLTADGLIAVHAVSVGLRA